MQVRSATLLSAVGGNATSHRSAYPSAEARAAKLKLP